LSIASNIINIVVLIIQRYSFITTLFLGPFDDVITKLYCSIICLCAPPIILSFSLRSVSGTSYVGNSSQKVVSILYFFNSKRLYPFPRARVL
jgi:hypothetical protein